MSLWNVALVVIALVIVLVHFSMNDSACSESVEKKRLLFFTINELNNNSFTFNKKYLLSVGSIELLVSIWWRKNYVSNIIKIINTYITYTSSPTEAGRGYRLSLATILTYLIRTYFCYQFQYFFKILLLSFPISITQVH